MCQVFIISFASFPLIFGDGQLWNFFDIFIRFKNIDISVAWVIIIRFVIY